MSPICQGFSSMGKWTRHDSSLRSAGGTSNSPSSCTTRGVRWTGVERVIVRVGIEA